MKNENLWTKHDKICITRRLYVAHPVKKIFILEFLVWDQTYLFTSRLFFVFLLDFIRVFVCFFFFCVLAAMEQHSPGRAIEKNHNSFVWFCKIQDFHVFRIVFMYVRMWTEMFCYTFCSPRWKNCDCLINRLNSNVFDIPFFALLEKSTRLI